MNDTRKEPPPGFHHAGSLPDLVGGKLHVELPGGAKVVVLSAGDGFYAIQSECPHRRGPLGDGVVMGRSIRCPLHLWKFDLADGTTIIDRRVVASVHDVRVEGQEVWIRETPRARPRRGGARRRRR